MNRETAGVVFQNYSFNTALGMLAVSALLFTILGLYLDKTIPSTFGNRRSICFCLMPSEYGCARKVRRLSSIDVDS